MWASDLFDVRPDILVAGKALGGGVPTGAVIARVDITHVPYQPAQAAIVHLPGGQMALRIDFAAPGPLGLLTGGASA